MTRRVLGISKGAFGSLVLIAGLGLGADLGVGEAQAKERGKAGVRSEASPSGGRTPAARTPSTRHSGSSTRRAVPRGSSPAERGVTRHQPRRHSPRIHHSGRHHRFGFSFGFGYPYYWGRYGFGWGYPYLYDFPYYGYPYPYYPWGWTWYRTPPTADALGAFDLNVKPKKVEVYLDGQYVGPAGKFDGFPGYLWVERGSHELIFYRPGYRTLVRRFSAVPGAVLDIKLRLERGEAVPPEEFLAKRTPAPAPDRDRQAAAAAPPASPAAPARPAVPARPAPGAEGRPAGTLDLRAAPARLKLVVEPADATVYLDGRLLGSGEELARLHSGLMVDPGDRRLEIVRPGYAPQEVEVRAVAGDETEVRVRLEPEPTGTG